MSGHLSTLRDGLLERSRAIDVTSRQLGVQSGQVAGVCDTLRAGGDQLRNGDGSLSARYGELGSECARLMQGGK